MTKPLTGCPQWTVDPFSAGADVRVAMQHARAISARHEQRGGQPIATPTGYEPASGHFDAIIADCNTVGPTVVTIAQSYLAFESNGPQDCQKVS
jgi:hypothetical protein